MEFVSYDEKPLSSRYDPDTCQAEARCFPLHNATSGRVQACSYSWDEAMKGEGAQNHRRKVEEECGFVPTGLLYNDVWLYDVDCNGSDNHNCLDGQRGWHVLHPGAKLGGCRTTDDDKRICDAPSERWAHGSAMLDSSTLLVYGGFSHECEDYCEDMWLFDLSTHEWRQVKFGDSSGNDDNDDEISPGARWKFSMNGGAIDTATGDSMVVLFGGHRLWHGYASDNSEANDWESRELLPDGGYMNDLWTYAKRPSRANANSAAKEYRWEQRTGKESCKPSPGASWESRNDIVCTINWPTGRSFGYMEGTLHPTHILLAAHVVAGGE